MKLIRIDCTNYSSKKEILKVFQQHLEEMFSLNYDALLDALTSYYDDKLVIELKNISALEDKAALLDTLNIAIQENPNISLQIEKE